ncbi:hypothetical protein AAMO2058_000085900 [Amorphochlora amoebiformis]
MPSKGTRVWRQAIAEALFGHVSFLTSRMVSLEHVTFSQENLLVFIISARPALDLKDDMLPLYPKIAARATRGLQRSYTGIRRLSSSSVRVHEVTPRDGLQNETSVLTLDDKLSLCQLLTESNPASIELTSFVRPDRVPALRDAKDLCHQVADQEWHQDALKRGIRFAALVPNVRGMENFLLAAEMGCPDTVVVITSCTEEHSKANVGMSIKDALKMTCEVIQMANDEGIRVQAYASMAFGCPFEGEVDPNVVFDIVSTYGDMGADVIGLADTLGVAYPEQVRFLVGESIRVLGGDSEAKEKLSLHMHDTSGTAQSTCYEGLRLGVRQFDSAVGGCGGCNFAPGAKGNLSTQSLLAVLDHAELDHGMDKVKLTEAHKFLETALKRPLDSTSYFSPVHEKDL